jgi:hypothetical protein
MRVTTLGKFLAIAAAIAVCGSVATAHAATILGQWTVETAPPADLLNSAASFVLTADAGTGTATGLHASAGTDWSTPAGNGSANSFSSNEWAIGDYYQFQTSSSGYFGIKLEWDQTRSSTGPSSFQLQRSTDGTLFTNSGAAYTVLLNDAANGGAWNGTTGFPNYHYAVDLSSVLGLNNDSSIYFRLAAASAPSSTGGTGRVDNFTVTGELIPEPASLALVGLAGLAVLGLGRRRS